MTLVVTLFLSGLFRNHVQHQHAEGFTPPELAHLHHPPLRPLLLRHLLRLHHPPLHVRQECHGRGGHRPQLGRAAADGEKSSGNRWTFLISSSDRCCECHTSRPPPAECATCKPTVCWSVSQGEDDWPPIKSTTFQGFGDILVPGLLLSYAHSYDLLAGVFWLKRNRLAQLFLRAEIRYKLYRLITSPVHYISYFFTTGIKYKLYWIITSVAYILGLVATFISLFLMNSAQPALLYLVALSILHIPSI